MVVVEPAALDVPFAANDELGAARASARATTTKARSESSYFKNTLTTATTTMPARPRSSS